MAVASTSLDFMLKMNKKTDSSSSSSSDSKNQLDFYESMYHFKKMFPKFESDVIEAILRSNNGQVDKTLDQLLTMSVDNDKIESELGVHQTENLISNNQNQSFQSYASSKIFEDSPPSYNEIMLSKSSSGSEVNFSSSASSGASDSVSLNEPKNDNLIDFNNKYEPLVQSSLNSLNENSNKIDYSKVKSSFSNSPKVEMPTQMPFAQSTLKNSNPAFIRNFNQILIGDLSKDFLRIKLTPEQVKSYKHSIKLAKRDEVAAILNNKAPKHPELSFELKRQLNILMNQLEENDSETDFDDWKEKYKSLMKSYERKRQQIIQDEYFAKLIQNEEFLNELRTDQDFINTLNDEIDQNKKYDDFNDYNYVHDIGRETKTISNAELISKLAKMGKSSRAKLYKLGTKFMSKAKLKYGTKSSSLGANSLEYNSMEPFNQSSLNSNSSLSKDDILVDIGEETYDLDKLKAEELNYKYNNTISSSNSRYKKVYKSFRSAIKRNNSSSTSSTLSSSSVYTDLNNNNTKSMLDTENSKTKNSKSSSIFQNGYSYDDDWESDKLDFYNHTSYPSIKSVHSSKK